MDTVPSDLTLKQKYLLECLKWPDFHSAITCWSVAIFSLFFCNTMIDDIK